MFLKPRWQKFVSFLATDKTISLGLQGLRSLNLYVSAPMCTYQPLAMGQPVLEWFAAILMIFGCR